ncbi:Hypothetical predicted protein [Lecanosticta acicola]|uniref:BTB domain-containing protein n=1 Tax=Lecanosticta acicola TaxID=111012 RepID=A0AAI9E765_9PEZI|nr:Hypothetical predicted protein [Lecanosticta acicola]
MAPRPNQVNLAENGDVLLFCGNGSGDSLQINILASSYTLSRASRIFHSEIWSRFADETRDPESQIIISLPDDPQSVLILCKALHTESLDVRELDLESLERLSRLVDKYDCSAVMRKITGHRFRGDLGTSLDDDRLALLVMSYQLEDKVRFQQIGWHLQMWNSTDIWIISEVEDENGILRRVAEGLNTHRNGIRGAVGQKIERILHRELGKHGFFQGDGPPPSSSCQCFNAWVEGLMRKLSRGMLWPADSLDYRSLSEACKALRELQADWPARDGACQTGCTRTYMKTVAGIIKRLKLLPERVEEQLLRICLKCVIKGDLGSLENRCERHVIWPCSPEEIEADDKRRKLKREY